MIDHDAIPEVGGMEWTHGLGHDRRVCRVKPYDMADGIDGDDQHPWTEWLCRTGFPQSVLECAAAGGRFEFIEAY